MMQLLPRLFTSNPVCKKDAVFFLQVFTKLKDFKETEQREAVLQYVATTASNDGPYDVGELIDMLIGLSAEYPITSKGYKEIEALIKAGKEVK